MKTINKNQKTVLKSLAVIFGFVLISITAAAQDLDQSFIQNKTNSELALAAADSRIALQTESNKEKATTDISSLTSQLQAESENTIELEEWMTNQDHFCCEQSPTKKKIISTTNFVYSELKDPSLEFESWMFNPNYWRIKK